MKNLKNITLYTQIHQFCDNESQKLLRLITFSWKSPKKLLHLLRDTQNSPSPWLNVVSRMEKLCYSRQSWPGMTKQTCNQHWIKSQGVQVSLFLWLIVGTKFHFEQKVLIFWAKVAQKGHSQKGFLILEFFDFWFWIFESILHIWIRLDSKF